MARSAADALGLSLAVIGVTQARCRLDSLAEHLHDDRLLILLDGPDGSTGVASIDAACLAALIQHQTIGKVTGRAGGAARKFTATDAALVAALVDPMLQTVADLTDLPADRACLTGYRFGAQADDLQSLMRSLDAERFRVFDLTLDFGAGAITGAICLVLSERREALAPAVPQPQSGLKLEHALGDVRAELTAVVCRVRIPLDELAALRPGDTVPILQGRLGETDLVTIEGRTVSRARLGQIGGLRALRLNETPGAMVKQFDPGAAAFATPVAVPGAAMIDKQIRDASVEVSEPVPSATADHGASSKNLDEDEETSFADLSPEEAAIEISQLAGLPLTDTLDA
jgi:flagellar motor switch/type III secretory pathway protein FliN